MLPRIWLSQQWSPQSVTSFKTSRDEAGKMEERKEEINLGLRESRLMNLTNLTNLINLTNLMLFIMCDFFLTKYINSKSQTWLDPKTVFEPFPNPKNSQLGPKNSKMTPKSSQNKMSELKKTKKMKVVQLHKYTPRQLSNPTPTQKIAH